MESSELLVSLTDAESAAQVAQRHGLLLKHRLISDPRMVVLDAGSIPGARKAFTTLEKDPAVRAVYFNPPTQNVPFPTQ